MRFPMTFLSRWFPSWLRALSPRWLGLVIAMLGIWFAALALATVVFPVKSYRAGVRPAVGEPYPEFALKDPEGTLVRLGDLTRASPVVLYYGSFTCPCWQEGRSDTMIGLQKKYADKAQFVFVYTIEPHVTLLPGLLPSDPDLKAGYEENWRDRAARARLFQKTMKLSGRVLVADDPRDAQTRFGHPPFLAVVLDRQGKVVFRDENWILSPTLADLDLAALVP